MYTNGFTKAPYQSLVIVTNAPKGYQVYTTTEFAAESEHIELRTAPNGKVFYRDETCSLVEFTGV